MSIHPKSLASKWPWKSCQVKVTLVVACVRKGTDSKGNCPPTSAELETGKTGPDGIFGFLGFKHPAPCFDGLCPVRSSRHSLR